MPLSWFNTLGMLLGSLAVLTLIASFLAFRYYRIASGADPVRVQSLEYELTELRSSYKSLETKLAEAPKAPALVIPQTQAPTATAQQTDVVPVAATPGSSAIFSVLPASTRQSMIPDPATLKFSVTQPRAFWSGGKLQVHFNIQYVKTDGGNQQGRIILLARGPETLVTYPQGVISAAGSESLLSPNQGEYFSVSRFREVKAEFATTRSKDSLKEVEVLILDHDGGGILLFQKVAVEKLAPPAPKPTAAAAAKTEKAVPKPAQPQTPKASEFIEPGVDR